MAPTTSATSSACSADGGGDDLRGGLAGGEGRPHRRPVRQAALGADREARRHRTAELSRRHHQRYRVHAGARTPDPRRQLEAYRQSAATLNLLRAFAHGGYANLEERAQLDARLRQGQPQSRRYAELADRISQALGFMQACGLDLESHPELRTTDFYTSHEALLLGFEQAMTREDSTEPGTGTPPPATWSGSATAPASPTTRMSSICRGIKNPLGLKCGPSLKPDDLLRLIDMLNPDNEPGRLTLICRFGADKAAELCRRWCARCKREGRVVVWSCDPMHGNTITAATGYKTRPFDRILQEVKAFFAVHAAEGTYAGGVHLEMTGQNVTECTGGARAITDEDLNDRYHTVCDPRLNAEQAIDLAPRARPSACPLPAKAENICSIRALPGLTRCGSGARNA